MFQSSNVELLLYWFDAEFGEYGGTEKLDRFCLFSENQGVSGAYLERCVLCFEKWKLKRVHGKWVWQCVF